LCGVVENKIKQKFVEMREVHNKILYREKIECTTGFATKQYTVQLSDEMQR
jgi:hypothetical protein